MPYGYSHSFVQEVERRASENPDPVIDLCMACINKGVMLSEAADELGVSKQTIYNWVRGAYQPKPEMTTRIKALAKKLAGKKKKG